MGTREEKAGEMTEKFVPLKVRHDKFFETETFSS